MTAPSLTRRHFKQLAELIKQVSKIAALTSSQRAVLVRALGIFCNQHNYRFDYEIFQAMVYGERLSKKIGVKQPTLKETNL